MSIIPQKQCTHCRETKPLTEFSKYRRNRDGARNWCKVCEKAGRRGRYKKAPDAPPLPTKQCTICHEVKPITEFYAQYGCLYGVKNQCKPCYVARNNKQRKQPGYVHYTYPRYLQDHILRNKYGITADQYDQMLAEQGGVCAICGKPETGMGSGGKIRRLAVDHCHTTKAVRGLLCGVCNPMIGRAHDDPELLRKAADYLERYK